MDAHRLRSVLDLILAEQARLGIDHKFAGIIQALGGCVAEPSSASDERFRVALTDLLASLRRSRTNDFVESDRRIVFEIRAERFIGAGLAERILDVANERPFLAGRAKERIIEIADELQGFIAACAGAQSAMQKLNVEPLQIGIDEYELGILLPDSLVHSDLDRLVKELKEWNQVLGELLPALCAKAPSVSIRTFSTRRFELSASIDRIGALALGTTIGGIYEMFRRIKDNRERAAELERRKYPQDIVGRIKDYEQQIVPEEMKAIREVVRTRFMKSDGKRRDLDKILDRGLRFLAVKIRDGVEVEIVGAPAADSVATSDRAETVMTHHVRAALQSAHRASAEAAKTKAAPDAGDGAAAGLPAPAHSAVDTRPPAVREPKAPTLPLSKIAGEEEEPPQQAA